ncbi:hypothetical protein [Cohnella yongneupensis]|uniref:Uncharacterized protein n=1 Tax=Cohnella yongneupensis TaxID=425006 RepID=A0ABW0QTZ1_9BACL
MKLSEAKYQHLVVTTPEETDVIGYDLAVKWIAEGKDIKEIRLLTDEAVHENLMSASRDLNSGRINLDNGPLFSRVSPGKNDGEIVEIDISKDQAIELITGGRR